MQAHDQVLALEKALERLIFSIEPEPFPGQQDENWKCPICSGSFMAGTRVALEACWLTASSHTTGCSLYYAYVLLMDLA